MKLLLELPKGESKFQTQIFDNQILAFENKLFLFQNL